MRAQARELRGGWEYPRTMPLTMAPVSLSNISSSVSYGGMQSCARAHGTKEPRIKNRATSGGQCQCRHHGLTASTCQPPPFHCEDKSPTPIPYFLDPRGGGTAVTRRLLALGGERRVAGGTWQKQVCDVG